MDHRVKNLFALAISVLNLSGRSAASVPEVIRSAGDRLSALARAHALTLSHGHKDVPQAAKPATLHTLIGAITAPHDARFDSGRVEVFGHWLRHGDFGGRDFEFRLAAPLVRNELHQIWRAFSHGRANPNPLCEPRRNPHNNMDGARGT